MNIHYLWIGPPTKTNPMAYAGHDLKGPIEMARRFVLDGRKLVREGEGEGDNIYFWCLAEYKETYEQAFRDAGVTILVHTVQDLLASSDDEEALNIKYLLDEPLKEKYRAILPSAYSDDLMQRVMFKDGFSLLLPLALGGLYLDTNVFPIKSRPLDLTIFKNLPVAVKHPDVSYLGDLYLFYSQQNEPKMKEAVEDWLVTPEIGKTSVLNESRMELIADDELIAHGLFKQSYKSYYKKNDYRGLLPIFYTNKFSSDLIYGDVNQVIPPGFTRLMSPLSLCYHPIPESTDADLLALPFSQNQALVSTRNKIYFVDKTTRKVACVAEQILDYSATAFPMFYTPGSPNEQLSIPEKIHLIKKFVTHENAQTSLIENTAEASLLHLAVMDRNLAKVSALIEAGADLHACSSFSVKTPEGMQNLDNLTPYELANFLGYDEIKTFFEDRTATASARM